MDTVTQNWLSLQCRMIAGVSAGLVAVNNEGGGPMTLVAEWPEHGDRTQALASAAQLSMSQRRGQASTVDTTIAGGSLPSTSNGNVSQDAIVCPFTVDGQPFGIVAVEIPRGPEPQHRNVMQLLQWGCAWLEVLLREQSTSKQRLVTALELTAAAISEERFQAAATGVATELATHLRCDRVSIGFSGGRKNGERTRVKAISHSAQFGSKTNLLRDIEHAMEEAQGQQASVVYPPATGPDAPVQPSAAHERLAKRGRAIDGSDGSANSACAICTVPIARASSFLGAITLERAGAAPFDDDTVAMCEHVASLVGPILEMKRQADRPLLVKARDGCRDQIAKVLGPGHPGLKLTVVALAGLVAFGWFAKGMYRVAADATLEGQVQRAAVAALDGFVAEAFVRAGDRVREGDALAVLDDRDLKLERRKWLGQKQQFLQEHRSALGRRDRTKISILAAQIEQADAELALLDAQLARTRIVAPFDGLVVSGDLSQSLGAPVERGQILFEIAPLDAYRVILKVDERDVSGVVPGQRGHLALSALPGEILPLEVETITPVSSLEDGRNYFRVEAKLDKTAPWLRPGMEGVSKIEVNQRKLLWIWTRKLVNWLRLRLWHWWG